VHELYSLADDLSESRDLAGQHPDKVVKLSKLMDNYLKETGALPTKRNPNFKAAAAAAAHVTRGLVPKKCTMELRDGALEVKAEAKASFLGTACAKFRGPLKVQLRIRGAKGGKVSLAWREKGSTDFRAIDPATELVSRWP
jgi:hypothetical protein